MDTTNDEGWIKLYRKSIHSQVFQNEGLWKIWAWCLMKANHKDRWISVKTGRGETQVLVKRGQFIFGRKTAAKDLKMPERTVHKRMLKLKTMQNCDIQSGSHFSIITIRNYNLYQDISEDEGTGKGTGKGQARDTNNNDKNEKKTTLSVKKTPDPRIKQFFDSWAETFLQKTGGPYVFSYGKEGKLIKDLLAVHDLETLGNTLKLFFQDERCQQRGFTIGIFFQEINRILSMKAMNPLEQARRELGTRA
jgi:hypothetical protein